MAKKHAKTAVVIPDVPESNINESPESIGHVPDVPESVEPVVPVVPVEPVVPAVPFWTESFRALFPGMTRIPSWVGPAATTIKTAFDSMPPADRKSATFDAWLAAFKSADPEPNDTHDHRYTGGGGRDIARTQNCLYVAIMVAGIRYADIKFTPFIDALWDFVIPVHTCNYRERKHSFTTLADYVRGDHNDTPGFAVNRVAERAVMVWRDAKPGDVPAASDPDNDVDVDAENWE